MSTSSTGLHQAVAQVGVGFHRRGMPVRTSVNAWRALPQPFLFSEGRSGGFSGKAIVAAANRGDLIRLANGLYVVAKDWDGLGETEQHLALCRAALVAVPDTVLSHSSAAVCLGLPKPTQRLTKVSLVSRSGDVLTSAVDDWKRVLHGGLTDEHWHEVDGLRITTPARTAADCIRTLGLRNGLAIADAAVRQGLMGADDLAAVRADQHRWPEVTNIDVALRLLDGRRESWLESASVVVAWRNGYSKPLSQVTIHSPEGAFVGRADFLWHRAGVIGEADGLGKYRGDFDAADLTADDIARRVLAERDRERGFEALGFGVARWGNKDLWQGGEGLVGSLVEARRRARPSSIACMWRLEPRDPLRPWSELTGYLDGLAA